MLSKQSAQTEGNVMVVCRFRPFNSKEIEMGTKCVAEFAKDQQHVTLKTQDYKTDTFMFDHVFDSNSTQKQVYDVAAKPIIDSVLEGFNGTIFAYGQTSSGKTHTMTGSNVENVELQGIIPRMVRTVFNRIDTASDSIEFSVKVSMIEIYMEKIRDLLDPSKDNLKVHEEKGKGVYMADITEQYISQEREVFDIMKQGNSNRSIASTLMNAESSRSHSIFILTVTQNNSEDLSQKTGRLYLVDLAGSEKISKTGAAGQVLEEAKMINKSLTTLGMVIYALTDKKSTHIPYRDSKLTRILSESLGGNSKTCLVITCSPHPYNDQETLSTMRFGSRARSIKNKPKVNREYTVPELKKLLDLAQAECEVLRQRIQALESYIKMQGLEIPQDLPQAQPFNIPSEVGAQLPSLSDELQEKLDRIDVLESNLEDKRTRLQQSQKDLSDLKEEYEIATQRLQLAMKQHETQQLQADEKIQQQIEENVVLKETNAELTDKIEQLTQTVQILTSEKTYLKKAYDNQVKKLKDVQDKNFLLPKQSKTQSAAETKIGTDEDHLVSRLEQEVRSLHHRLLQNSNQTQQKSENEANQVVDPAFDRQYESQVIAALTGQSVNKISFTQPVYFDQKTLLQIYEFQQVLQSQVNSIQNLTHAQESQMSQLQQRLNNNLSQVELQKLQQEVAISDVKAKFDKERVYMSQCLQQKIDKITQLEVQLDEIKDFKRAIEMAHGPEVKSLQERIRVLERNNEDLNVMYQQQVNENCQFRVNYNLLDRTIQRKDEKIQNITKKNARLTEKVNKLASGLQILREQFVQVQQSASNSQKKQNDELGALGQTITNKKITMRGRDGGNKAGGNQAVKMRNTEFTPNLKVIDQSDFQFSPKNFQFDATNISTSESSFVSKK